MSFERTWRKSIGCHLDNMFGLFGFDDHRAQILGRLVIVVVGEIIHAGCLEIVRDDAGFPAMGKQLLRKKSNRKTAIQIDVPWNGSRQTLALGAHKFACTANLNPVFPHWIPKIRGQKIRTYKIFTRNFIIDLAKKIGRPILWTFSQKNP